MLLRQVNISPAIGHCGRPSEQYHAPAQNSTTPRHAALSVPSYLYLKGPAEPEEVRFRVPRNLTSEPTETQPGNETALNTFDPGGSAISPDGRTMVLVARARRSDPWLLYVRPVGSLTPRLLAGTEDASQPFWSPDSRWVAYVERANQKLRRVQALGGRPQDISDAPGFSGGTWNRADQIVFGSASGLYVVPAEGGTRKPSLLTTLEPSERGHFWPRFLPDGRHYLYLAASPEAAAGVVLVGALDSKNKTEVMKVLSHAVYTDAGYLLFRVENAVYAQRFNARTFALSGKKERVADEVLSGSHGQGFFDVSSNGVLVYYHRRSDTLARDDRDSWEFKLFWADRAAVLDEAVGTPGIYRGVEASPANDKRIAVHRHDGTGGDIWVMAPPPQAPRNITLNAAQNNSSPVWSPDGSQIVFASHRNGTWGLYLKPSDGSGAERTLLEKSAAPLAPMSWSLKGGNRLVYWVNDPKTKGDLWMLPMDGGGKPVVFINTPADETHAQVSPDGKWIAFASTGRQNKRKEVYVKPFPSGEGEWQVSLDAGFGGDWPRWKGDSTELYFHSVDALPALVTSVRDGAVFQGVLYSASVAVAGTAISHGIPVEVLQTLALRNQHEGGDYHTYDVSPDGKRFLVFQRVRPAAAAATGETGPELGSQGLTVAMHWTGKLKKD